MVDSLLSSAPLPRTELRRWRQVAGSASKSPACSGPGRARQYRKANEDLVHGSDFPEGTGPSPPRSQAGQGGIAAV